MQVFLWENNKKGKLPVCQTALPCQLCSAPGWNNICCWNSFSTNAPFPRFVGTVLSNISTTALFLPKVNGIKVHLWAVTSRMSVWGTACVNSIEVLRTSYSWHRSNVWNSSNQSECYKSEIDWHRRNVYNYPNQSDLCNKSDQPGQRWQAFCSLHFSTALKNDQLIWSMKLAKYFKLV